MLELTILFFVVIIASGVCSMAEAAILSLPLVRARILYEQHRRQAKDLLYVKEHISLAVASIVVINNAVNIAGSIFVGQKVTQLFGNEWLGWTSTILTFTIIIASEIIPKTVGERFKIPLSLFFSKPLKLAIIVFRPFLNIIIRIARPISATDKFPKVTEEEIKMMLKLGRDAGTVELDEEVLCNRVFKLNDLRAYQIMKRLDEVYAIAADKTLAELKDAIIDSRYSRIVVYDKDPSDVVGVVQHRALLRAIATGKDSSKVREFMVRPIFVNWFTKADALLEKFQAYNQHLFIVQDTNGKDAGIVTMEDVLEELFGEIYDEKDVKPKKAELLNSFIDNSEKKK